MKRGVLYGVGVGPGDPELLTLKAQRILRETDVIAVPDKGAGEKTALNIIGPLSEGKDLLYCEAPMTRDPALLEAAYGENARRIAAVLDEGRSVAFITLGDPSIYSTYLYTHRRVLAMGYKAEIIPGVPSFCAVAAALGDGLCEGSDRLLIVPASHRDVGDCLTVDANYVFMKAGRAGHPGGTRAAGPVRHGGELRHGGGAGISPVCRRAGGERVFLRGGGEAGWGISGSPCSWTSPEGAPWSLAAGRWGCGGGRSCGASGPRSR